MLDERSASEAELDPGQKLKRTHNTSFGAAMEDHGNDTPRANRAGIDVRAEHSWWWQETDRPTAGIATTADSQWSSPHG